MSIKKVYQFKYIRNTNRLEPYKVDIASNLLITQQSIGVDNLILLFEQNYDSVNSEVLSLLKEYPKNHIIEFYLGDDKRLYITDYISKNPIKVVKNNIGELCYESTGNIVKKEIIENNDLEIKDDFIVVKNKVEIIKENVGVKVKNTKDYKAIIKELKTKNERLTQDNKNLHYELQNLDKQFIKLQVEKKTIEDQKQEILKTKRESELVHNKLKRDHDKIRDILFKIHSKLEIDFLNKHTRYFSVLYLALIDFFSTKSANELPALKSFGLDIEKDGKYLEEQLNIFFKSIKNKGFKSDDVLYFFANRENRLNEKICDIDSKLDQELQLFELKLFDMKRGDKLDLNKVKIIGTSDSDLPRGRIIKTEVYGLESLNGEVIYKAEAIVSE